jgi:hypothetical protein
LRPGVARTALILGPALVGLACAGFDEPAADVSHPLSLERAHVSVQYPGNWTVGQLDGIVPENGFTLESPGGCMVAFLAFELAMDPEELHGGQVGAFEQLVSRATRSEFGSWGGMEGRGTRLVGNVAGLLPGSVRIFSTVSDRDSLVVIEQCYDENVGAQAGLELIERSFRHLL